MAQLALRKAGVSEHEVNHLVDQWNDWVDGGTLHFEWNIGLEERLDFYRDLWKLLRDLSWEELKGELKINELAAFENHLKIV